MSNATQPWRLYIDTGGTFTDCIAAGPDSRTRRIKVLSSSRLRGQLLERLGGGWFHLRCNWPVVVDIFEGYAFYLLDKPAEPLQVLETRLEKNRIRLSGDIPISSPAAFEITAEEEAPILAARLATATPMGHPLPPIRMRLGSTKGTNALLEHKGAEVALLITKGLGDLPYIGTQQRPHLFQLNIPEPPKLYHTVIEVAERLGADGEVIEPLAEEEIGRALAAVRQSGCRSVAVALLHAYRNPVHELQLGEALRRAGIPFLSLSQQLTPSIKLLPRAQAALTNAYLSPVIHDYLSHIRERLGEDQQLRIMTSAGGLVSADLFNPKDSLLSGPAGGVAGSAAIAQQLGFDKVLTLDMGGTSTDAARYDGQYDYKYTTRVGDVSMLSPCLAIETVAAGGGSICSFDGQKLTVGPESAGASPGPACYGAGGPLAITDINLLLGKLDPAVMGIPISREKARQALLEMKAAIESATGEPHTEEELLRGFEQIANEKMAEAIRRISVAKGFDPADYALLAFGGAGGLHACRIAELLSIDSIILPYDGGLLSAYGMGQAQVERLAERQVLQLLDNCQSELPALLQQLSHQAIKQLQTEGFPPEATEIRHTWAYLRFRGQDSTLEVAYHSPDTLEEDFRQHYERLFGHWPEGRAIELESLKVVAASHKEPVSQTVAPEKTYRPEPQGQARAALSGIVFPVFYWDQLQEGALLEGPALLLNSSSSAFIEPGWRLLIYKEGNALLELQKEEGRQVQNLKEAVELELFTNRFSSIAEEMGAQLQRTAFSVNIKERLDFSCALLDANAELLVNAPHIPVHLGSLGICARLVLEKLELRPGDIIITNHPKYGGSHLPDVTLLSGIFTEEHQLIGYAINRAHHAEIGGKRPGSMPPDATTLEEEGVAIPPTYLAKGGKVLWGSIRALLAEAPYPTRSLEENLADINAALAALRTGEAALQRLVITHGLKKVHYYMAQLKSQAADSLHKALRPWAGKVFEAEERMDDGRPIRVKIAIGEMGATIDFAGTGSPHPHNLNANISIVYSAVIYVLRLLCKKEIPLNEGLMQQVQIKLPESFLHPHFEDDARHCPAVVGGNTEASQRLVDTLIKSFGLAACSQGTMNNFLFGNARFGYYETIGGGAGAGPGFPGRSAVHQHMTNTKITDPEELEFRYPVRLHRFARRAGSGGQGRYQGGEGIIREVEFLEPMELTILSQHRVERPYGMQGGEAGKAGAQYLKRKNGKEEPLEGVDSTEAEAGDRIVIETPGGGGWGKPA